MNKKIKLITAGIIAVATIAVAASVTNNGLSIEKLSAGECLKHTGNHYTALAPTEDSSGTKEYYICCDCHTVILSTEHTPGDGDWNEAGVAGKVDYYHRAYDAPYHSLFGKFSNKDYWQDIKLTQNSFKPSEYMILNIGLTKGDEFVIRMDQNTWYHYNDVKSGCKSLVSNNGENILINETGNYNIYADYNGSNNEHIWIETTGVNEPRIVGNFSSPEWSYAEGIALSLSGNTYSVEIEAGIGAEIKICDGTTWYDNWDEIGNEDKNAFVYTCTSVLSGKNARFNVDGVFIISFEQGTNPSIFIEKKSVDSPYKMVETFGSYTQKSDLVYKPVKGDSSKVVYHRSNQVFWSNEIIQITYNGTLKSFSLSDNTDKNLFKHYDDVGSSYIRVPEQVTTYCEVSLFLNTSDLSLTIDIVYM